MLIIFRFTLVRWTGVRPCWLLSRVATMVLTTGMVVSNKLVSVSETCILVRFSSIYGTFTLRIVKTVVGC